MNKKYYLLILFLLVYSGLTNCKPDDTIILPKMNMGILDIEEIDFTNKKIPLVGEWEFYWNELRNEFKSPQDEKLHYAHIPNHWIDLESGKDTSVSIEGVATFKASILLPNNQEKLGLRIPPMDTAFTLYWNGEEIARNGNVYEKDGETYPEYYAPQIVSLNSAKEGKNEIYLHMANSIYPRPGFRDTIILGLYDELEYEFRQNLSVDVFLTGGLFIIGLYHLGLWVLRRNDVSTLYFALLSLTLVFRIPVQGEAVAYQFLPMFWKLSTFIEYFTFYFAYGFLGLFIKSLYPKESIRFFDQFIIGSVSFFIGILVLFPLSIYTRTLIFFEILTVILCSYYFYILIKAIINKRQSSIGFLIALFLFLLTYINDVLYTSRVIDSFYMTGLGLFIFFFAQAFLLSKRFATAFNTAETLTLELDAKVRERTKALESEKEKSDKLLKNIQRDLNYSKKIQNSILPKIPSQKGFKVGVLYEPMNEVGGDIYDFFKLNKDKNKYRFMIADATGHGVQGALVTMAIKSEYENIKKFIRTPSELMEVLNISIVNTYKTMYFSCVIIDIDLDKKTLEYSSAGHPEQVLLRGSDIKCLYKTGPIIGLKQNIEYTSQVFELKNKDSIYIFSDGIFEVFNDKSEEFGEKNFYETIKESHHHSPRKKINHIMEALKQFKGSNKFEDDITLIILELE
ncbi:MAG: SpoIIE family protein phosphatase [Leptospira sp.]|nr:SpoIIE family protein phosphatase [Leptospira sp.]